MGDIGEELQLYLVDLFPFLFFQFAELEPGPEFVECVEAGDA